MESHTYYDYSGMDNGTKVHHFLQGTKSTELEAVINVLQAQQEKNCKNFYATVSYLGQIVMNKGFTMQSVCIANNRS